LVIILYILGKLFLLLQEFTRFISGNQRVFNLASFTDRTDRISMYCWPAVSCVKF